MKCSTCFFCEKTEEFFFCKCHYLEVFNPEFAGCNEGRISLKVIIGNIKEEITHCSKGYPVAKTHCPSKISALASKV
ncbi:MAG: hypothetical protein JRJ04_06255 [Deltaproteobacteria bacterium]|nr:hypothetical protein [Deltaproteobacteria bacterium]